MPETKVFSFSKYSSFDFDLSVEKKVVPGTLDLLNLTGSTECEKVCDLKFYTFHTEERLMYLSGDRRHKSLERVCSINLHPKLQTASCRCHKVSR